MSILGEAGDFWIHFLLTTAEHGLCVRLLGLAVWERREQGVKLEEEVIQGQ